MSDAVSSSQKNISRANSRESISLFVADVSSLAKSLRAAIAAQVDAPSQVQMLNWLAKGAGYQNYQSLRASANRTVATTAKSLDASAPVKNSSIKVDANNSELTPHATKALTQFDADGKLARWPYKFAVQRIAMWGLWLRFDAKKRYT
ncbi:MAG: hypothetical protein ACRCWJ_09175, partial [Casimicrobium sp.]